MCQYMFYMLIINLMLHLIAVPPTFCMTLVQGPVGPVDPYRNAKEVVFLLLILLLLCECMHFLTT